MAYEIIPLAAGLIKAAPHRQGYCYSATPYIMGFTHGCVLSVPTRWKACTAARMKRSAIARLALHRLYPLRWAGGAIASVVYLAAVAAVLQQQQRSDDEELAWGSKIFSLTASFLQQQARDNDTDLRYNTFDHGAAFSAVARLEVASAWRSATCMTLYSDTSLRDDACAAREFLR